jgi:hypothetical protein
LTEPRPIKWALEESARRDDELTTGKVIGRTHEQVMAAARKTIQRSWFTS